jgi:hypothetical protein
MLPAPNVAMMDVTDLELLRLELGLVKGRWIDARGDTTLSDLLGGVQRHDACWAQISQRAAASWLAGVRVRDPRYGSIMGAELLPGLCADPVIMFVVWRTGLAHTFTPRGDPRTYDAVSERLKLGFSFDVSDALATLGRLARETRLSVAGWTSADAWVQLAAAAAPVHVFLDGACATPPIWPSPPPWLPAEWLKTVGGTIRADGPPTPLASMIDADVGGDRETSAALRRRWWAYLRQADVGSCCDVASALEAHVADTVCGWVCPTDLWTAPEWRGVLLAPEIVEALRRGNAADGTSFTLASLSRRVAAVAAAWSLAHGRSAAELAMWTRRRR